MRFLGSRLAVAIAIILVIGLLGFLSGKFGSLEWLIENESRMRQFSEQHRWQGWLLGLGIYTAFSLVPGTVGKSVIWGWLFGFWPAVAIVDIGLTVAAVANFWVARFLIRDAMNVRLQGLAETINKSLKHDIPFYLLMVRFAHVPYSLVNYGAGATTIRTWTFAWTTAIGLLPGTMIFVFVGTRIPTIASLAEQGAWQLLDPLLMCLLAATLVFPLSIRWAMRRCRMISGSVSDAPFSNRETWDEWTIRG